jgi:hypothetical protein
MTSWNFRNPGSPATPSRPCKLVNEAELDWQNIAKEIKDVVRTKWRAVESLLGQALRHMLKAKAWTLSKAVARLVKGAAADVGLDAERFSDQSLYAWLATAVALGYLRPAEFRRHNVAKVVFRLDGAGEGT